MTRVAVERSRASILTADIISGATLEVADLDAARSFYDRIFRDAGGAWQAQSDALTYQAKDQKIAFVKVAEPRVLADSAQHQAYRVPRGSLQAIADEMEKAGLAPNWWHEDHPSEGERSIYLHDPSGNRVQLIAADGPGPLLEHFAFEVHNLEPISVFYLAVLGGTIDHYFGRNMDDYEAAKAWGGGNDPDAAPWTRFFPRGNSLNDHMRRAERQSHPSQQISISFGDTRVCVFLGTVHRQDPPEDQVVGAPRVAFRTKSTADEVVAGLRQPTVSLEPEGRIRLLFERNGSTVYARDPIGHFIQIDCR
jgi:catechol 2,3-dioxygenase-like lactoylglutathione lyase family enzyme